jgi:hypothetical protein
MRIGCRHRQSEPLAGELEVGLRVASKPVDVGKHVERFGTEVLIGKRTGDSQGFLSPGRGRVVLTGDHREQDACGDKSAAALECGLLGIWAVERGG